MLSVHCCVFPLLCLHILTGVSCEELTAVREEEFSLEGSTVTLSYNYSIAATLSDYFFWYRQNPGNPPQFLLYHSGSGSILTRADPDSGLSVEKSKDQKQITAPVLRRAACRLVACCCATVNVWCPTSAMQLILSMIVLALSVGSSSHQTIQSVQDRVQAAEGDTVTLSCNYTAADYFFWYQQFSSSSPQLLITEYSNKPGLTLKIDKVNKRIELLILSAAVTDSAVYYCAVKPTVTGNNTTLY
ncbi:uncharacterized protein LOC142988136 [Genypterus blacodes]|uniref:uncharacterized protein LOC142988136 n=1 Tax=Genypterus blacodes TaxID=154954 RepID=UPI003F7578FC